MRFPALAIVLVGSTLPLVAGCAAPTMVAAGASLTALEFGVTTWNKGELSAAELGTMDETHAAVRRTLTELGFPSVTELRADNGRWTKVSVVDGQDRKITIRCSRISPAMTKLRIRVGLLGDEAVSVALQRQVNERLRAERERQAAVSGGSDAASPDGPSP